MLSICFPTFLSDTDKALPNDIIEEGDIPIDPMDLLYYFAVSGRQLSLKTTHRTQQPAVITVTTEDKGDIITVKLDLQRNTPIPILTATIPFTDCNQAIRDGNFSACRNAIRKNVVYNPRSGYNDNFFTRYTAIEEVDVDGFFDMPSDCNYIPFTGVMKLVRGQIPRSYSTGSRQYIFFPNHSIVDRNERYIPFSCYPQHFYDTYLQSHIDIVDSLTNGGLQLDEDDPLYQLYGVQSITDREEVIDKMNGNLTSHLMNADTEFFLQQL